MPDTEVVVMNGETEKTIEASVVEIDLPRVKFYEDARGFYHLILDGQELKGLTKITATVGMNLVPSVTVTFDTK